MMAGSSTSALASSDSQSMSGMGMGDLMAPLMMLLLEQMLEQQLNQSSTPATSADTTTADAASSNTTASAGTSSANVSTTLTSQPKGRPVGGVLTQEFHTGHTGIDLAVVTGTPVKATMDGKVVSAGWNTQGYGNLVIVENGAYRTYYAHLSSIPVAVGDTVKAGSVIGLSGSTGNSTGPHLHYEIRKNNVPIDPAPVTLGVSA
jgi:murein DD-endopeptidase MepM/ murein hydrolase activator NlpD